MLSTEVRLADVLCCGEKINSGALSSHERLNDLQERKRLFRVNALKLPSVPQ